MIDLHSHVLPGIDDGPATIEGALALARAAAAAGTVTLVATPHVSWRYRNEPATIARLVAQLNERLRAERVLTAAGEPLEVRTGAELAVTLIDELDPEQLELLGLGGGPWLLVEPPFTPVAPNLEALLLALRRDGRRVVLAHPERCPVFHRDPELLARLVRAGIVTSVTAGSFGGRFGSEARRFALALAREGLLHNVASDAHDEIHRAPVIAAELERAGLAALTPWLTETTPAAILAGAELLPPPPAPVTAGARRARLRWPQRTRS